MEVLDKTIVITGASKGLGWEIAVRLSQKYANIILVARSKDLLEQLRKEIAERSGRSPLAIACDIADENEVRCMGRRFRKISNASDCPRSTMPASAFTSLRNR